MKFRKSDLRDGDIVTYRSGEKRVVYKNELVEEDRMAANTLNNYAENLKDDCGDTEFDIVKVERPRYETVFERKEEILDEAEKRYLRNVIRPFRSKVESISKQVNYDKTEYIEIELRGMNIAYLPDFEANTMYKNMEVNREYTLKELGL